MKQIRLFKILKRILMPVMLVLMLSLTGCSFLEEIDFGGSTDSGKYDYSLPDVSEETVNEPVEKNTPDDAGPEEQTEVADADPDEEQVQYHFRNEKLLKQHYEKHGIEMGFDSPEEYEAAASAVIYNPDVLTKTEKEDGDYVFYVEETNEFVVVSTDGFIRTYFLPSGGKSYFDRQ